MEIPGFDAVSQLYASRRSLVWRGRRAQDGLPVVLKMLNPDGATREDLVCYQREYSVLRALDNPRLIRPVDFVRHQSSCVLIVEDFGASSLRSFRMGPPLSIPDFLEIAITTVDNLHDLHRAGVIHRDLNPDNIVLNPTTREVKIIDFGVSSLLAAERPGFESASALVGTLAYMSPEQTGRTSRVVDVRSDLYALGVTFFEMLTGRTTFSGRDAMELVHCHLARKPPPVTEARPDVPEAISRIIDKLLAKEVEARYQSAAGLRGDLERCLAALQATGEIAPFALGSLDAPLELRFSQKLYGRAAELAALEDAFSRAAAGAREMVLIAGYSGIGKSALLRELYRPITERRGVFLSGKYDQYQRDAPNSAICAAFHGLVQQILSEEEAELAAWRALIQGALGKNGGVLTPMIPGLELVVGAQPPPQEVPVLQARIRFHRVFRDFVRAIAAPDRPLVLFLDDLQWADASSLSLIEALLLDEDISHLCVIGAYRDNEVDAVHPTQLAIHACQRKGAAVCSVALGPLAPEHTRALLADTLQCTEERVAPLADLVHAKTQGNPFFVVQFIQALERNGLLVPAGQRRESPSAPNPWTWDVARIAGEAMTDNVIDLMTSRLRELPDDTQRAMSTAALLGNQVTLRLLSVAMERPEGDVFATLGPALRAGLVLPIGRAEPDPRDVFAAPVAPEIRFAHDRIHQISYLLIDEASRPAAHLRLGRLLLRCLEPAERERRLFDVVSHLDRGRALITDPEERAAIVRLNLEAGRRAMRAQAPRTAARYLRTACEELGEEGWRAGFDLAFEANVERADAEALSGAPEIAERVLRDTLTRTDDRIRKTAVYRVLLRLMTLDGRYSDALRIGADALALFGVEVPTEDPDAALGPLAAEVEAKLAGRSLEEITNLPTCTSPELTAVVKTIFAFVPAAFFVGGTMYTALSLLRMSVFLDAGMLPEAAGAVAGYAMHHVERGDYRRAEETGRAALRLAERFDAADQWTIAGYLYGAYVLPWVAHVEQTDAFLDRTLQCGLQSGMPHFSAYAVMNQQIYSLFRGRDLDETRSRTAPALKVAREAMNRLAEDAIVAVELVAANLVGTTEGRLRFESKNARSAEDFLAECRKRGSNYAICCFLVNRALIHYLLGDARSAYADLESAEATLPALMGNLIVAEHAFLRALAEVALLPRLAGAEAEAARARLQSLSDKLAGWSATCPENFRHRALLVEAERARVGGRPLDAIARFGEAILAAHEHGFPQVEALAHELAGRFWLGAGQRDYARVHLAKARRLYARWGAAWKVEALVAEHGALCQGDAPAENPDKATSTVEGNARSLDIISVVKASQTIAREIMLGRLLATLLDVSLENAGATRGAFFLADPLGGLSLAVDAEPARGATVREGGPPLSAWDSGPRSIVQYVARTQEHIILDDATAHPVFRADPFVAREGVRSVLCMPLLKQGSLTGVLYLENRMAGGLFTAERIELLQILSAQIAISLENARLYEDVERAMQEARESDELKTQFLANTSHELRTPLNAIINVPSGLRRSFAHEPRARCGRCHAEFALDPGEEITPETPCPDCGALGMAAHRALRFRGSHDELAQLLDSVERSGRHLLELVESVLEFSRLESAPPSLARETIRIREVMESVTIMMTPLAADKRLSVAVSVRGDDEVAAVPYMLRQVLTNLLSNAIKFSHEGGRIELGCADEGATVRLWVRDEGIGIPRESRGVIFERFRQLDAGNTRARGGMGLGLSIVKRIVAVHGGTIAVDGELGRGSTFEVRLPRGGMHAQGS